VRKRHAQKAPFRVGAAAAKAADEGDDEDDEEDDEADDGEEDDGEEDDKEDDDEADDDEEDDDAAGRPRGRRMRSRKAWKILDPGATRLRVDTILEGNAEGGRTRGPSRAKRTARSTGPTRKQTQR